ncbi:hypothetical protein FRC12_021723 [Ceratobasidium sp. 428]|nr:hypothetical protein FRC12_021723 [Ceratobasidium sp. 428]
MPANFPELPVHMNSSAWSPLVQSAYRLLASRWEQTYRLIRLNNGDVARLRAQRKILENECILTLEDLCQSGLPESFIDDVLDTLAQAIYDLDKATSDMEDGPSGITRVEGVWLEHRPTRGRPRKIIDPSILAEAFHPSRHISVARLCRALPEVGRTTMYQNLLANNIERRFSSISTSDLNLLIKDYKASHPTSGYRIVQAHLRQSGIRIQRDRVLESLREVDHLGVAQRQSRTIVRRIYSSPRPNYLWHMDGHHKLGPWGFVIHGIIDGFDRTITGIRVSNNNRATTVLNLFIDAVRQYECPSRCRGDRGGENIAVAMYMTIVRGPNRASYMWGSSTNNQRIERLWLDVGKQFARIWRAFFICLENCHQLDRSNTHHLWLLQVLFLGQLNSSALEFQQHWNLHGVSGPTTHNQTPEDMRFLGQLEHGIQDDIYEDVPLEILQQYLGVDTNENTQGSGTNLAAEDHIQPLGEVDNDGGGDDLDERDLEPEEQDILSGLREQLQVEQATHVRHPPVRVPVQRCPFDQEEEILAFEELLAETLESGDVPHGYGVRPEEWENGVYPEEVYIGTGRKGRKKDESLYIPLPKDVWLPRATQWAVGLYVLDALLNVF